MNRTIIPASLEHEKSFRETFRLKDEVANDPYWQMAYEYAAKNCLYLDEMNTIGPMLIRRTK